MFSEISCFYKEIMKEAQRCLQKKKMAQVASKKEKFETKKGGG